MSWTFRALVVNGLLHKETRVTTRAHRFVISAYFIMNLNFTQLGFDIGKRLVRYSAQFSLETDNIHRWISRYFKCNFFVLRTFVDVLFKIRLVSNVPSRIDIHYWKSEKCGWTRYRVFFSISWNISFLLLRQPRNELECFECHEYPIIYKIYLLGVRNSSMRISYIIRLTAFTIRDITYTEGSSQGELA